MGTRATLFLVSAALAAAILAAWGSVAARAVRAQNGYTLESLAGAYAFTEQGSVGSAALAGIGRIVFDGAGRVSGQETLQTFGTTLATVIEGTYEIDPSGVGTLTLLHRTPADPEAEAAPDVTPSMAKYSFVVTEKIAGLKALRLEQGVLVVANLERQ